MSTVQKLYHCGVCEQKTKSRCARCRQVYYCSQSCQKKDWKSHKQTCTQKEEADAKFGKIDYDHKIENMEKDELREMLNAEPPSWWTETKWSDYDWAELLRSLQ